MEDTEYTNDIRPTNFLSRILTILGLWTFNTNWNRFYRVYGALFHTMFSVLFVIAMYINLASIENVEDATEALYMSLTESAMLIKMFNAIFHGKTFIAIINSMFGKCFDPRNQNEIQQFKKFYEQFNRIRVIYLILCLLSITCAFILPLLVKERKFPFPAWFPFDWRNSSKAYWSLYAYEVIAMTINCLGNASIDLLQAFLLFQAGMCYKLIGLRLKGLGEHGKSLSIQQDLIESIKTHQEIIRLIKPIKDVVSLPIFFQFNLSSIIICVSVFQLKNISPLEDTPKFSMFLFYIIAVTFQTLLPCYYGNFLVEESSTLIDSIYHSNWIDQSLKYKKFVFIYMESLKEPNRIKIYGLFYIGLEIFVTVINTSYRLFALLLNMDK